MHIIHLMRIIAWSLFGPFPWFSVIFFWAGKIQKLQNLHILWKKLWCWKHFLLLYAKVQRLTCWLLCLKMLRKIRQQIQQLILTTLFGISSWYVVLKYFPQYVFIIESAMAAMQLSSIIRILSPLLHMTQVPAVLRLNIHGDYVIVVTQCYLQVSS